MAISTTVTVTIPPQASVVCDKLWIQGMDVRTTNFQNETVKARLTLRYYGLDGEGNKVWATGPTAVRTVDILDLFADAANDADVANCLNQILTVANSYVAMQDAARSGDSSSSSGTPDDQQGDSSSSSSGV